MGNLSFFGFTCLIWLCFRFPGRTAAFLSSFGGFLRFRNGFPDFRYGFGRSSFNWMVAPKEHCGSRPVKVFTLSASLRINRVSSSERAWSVYGCENFDWHTISVQTISRAQIVLGYWHVSRSNRVNIPTHNSHCKTHVSLSQTQHPNIDRAVGGNTHSGPICARNNRKLFPNIFLPYQNNFWYSRSGKLAFTHFGSLTKAQRPKCIIKSASAFHNVTLIPGYCCAAHCWYLRFLSAFSS